MAVNCSVRSVDSAQQYIKGRYSSTVGLATSILGKVLLGTLQGTKRRKEVIKLCVKDIEQQFADRVAEDPRMEIEFMKAICNSGHPNFVRYLDSVEDRKRYCIVMEHIAGGDFCTHLQNLGHGITDAHLQRKYAAQLTKAVYHMHCAGYCHLDLSLENVLWDKRADMLKICDFGLCRKLDMSDSDALFDSATIRPGKKGYMAPEIYAYQKFSGQKADVFSLGVLLFILLTGFPPFVTPNASDKCFQHVYYGKFEWLMEQWEVTDVISKDCRALLARMLCPPKKRISMREMLAHPWLGLDVHIVDKENARYTANVSSTANVMSSAVSDSESNVSSLSVGDNKEQSPTASPAPAAAPPPAEEVVAVVVAAAAPATVVVTAKVITRKVSQTQRRQSTEGKKRKSMTIVKKKRLSKGNGKVRRKSIVKHKSGHGHRREESPSAGSLSSMSGSNGESDGSSHSNRTAKSKHTKATTKNIATAKRKVSISNTNANARTTQSLPHNDHRTPPSSDCGALNDTQLITQRYQQRQEQGHGQHGLVLPADPFSDENTFDNDDRKEGNETYDPYMFQQQHEQRERNSLSQQSNEEEAGAGAEAGAAINAIRRLSLASDAGSVHSHHSHSHPAHEASESENNPEEDEHVTPPGPEDEYMECAYTKKV